MVRGAAGNKRPKFRRDFVRSSGASVRQLHQSFHCGVAARHAMGTNLWRIHCLTTDENVLCMGSLCLPMTLANQITIGRLLLTPVFVGFCLYYGFSIREGQPRELWWWLAVITFATAALSDGIDGFIARRFNQRSRLGSMLDPLADKALLLAAVITLSFTSGLAGWPEPFPLWFPILVIAREAILISGALLMHYAHVKTTLQHRVTGKLATFFQIVAVSWLMLNLPKPNYLILPAGIFTLISGLLYIRDGIHQAQASGYGEAENQ